MNELKEKIIQLKTTKKAVILSHTYQPGEIQDIADFVGDSYGLSVQATKVKEAEIILFCGVRFMAETAAILSPDKKVIMPNARAGCPMADMITPEELEEFKKRYPDSPVMCYVNSTAEIKALADICCTSSNAVKIAQQLPKDKAIIFVPDKHLGSWIQENTGHEMILWDGFCPTHVHIKTEMVSKARVQYPSAKILIHPEAPKASRDLADAVLSTGGMCEYVKNHSDREYVIATEIGIIHTLKRQNPEKKFYSLDQSLVCPNMKMGSLSAVINALEGTDGLEVKVPEHIAALAYGSLEKMITMSQT